MQKLLFAVAVVLAIAMTVSYGGKKRAENLRNHTLAYEFLFKVCGDNARCKSRLERRINVCFGAAYTTSLVPEGDTVNFDALISCLNGQDPVFVVGKGQRVPFPTN